MKIPCPRRSLRPLPSVFCPPPPQPNLWKSVKSVDNPPINHRRTSSINSACSTKTVKEGIMLGQPRAKIGMNSERAFVEDLHGFITKSKGVNAEPAQVGDEGGFNAHASDQR